MAHLSSQIQHRFLARLLSPEEALDVVKHLRECGACREKLLALRSDKPGSLLNTILPAASDEEHPSPDSLGAYSDNDLTHSDKADLEAHLRTCELCRKALADLRSFREELLQSPAQEYTPVGISRSTNSDSRGRRSEQEKPGFLSRFNQPLVFAGVAAVGALVLVIGTVVIRFPATFGISAGPQISITDDGYRVLLRPNGIVNPPVTLPKAELAALNSLTNPVWRDELPVLSSNVKAALTSLNRAPSVLLGQTPAAPPFHVVCPVHTLIPSVRPTFKWTPAPVANRYIVHVIADDRTQEEVATSPSLSTATTNSTTGEWTIPESMSLTQGKRYRWYVTAVRNDQEVDAPGIEEPEAKFAVLSQDDFARLNASKKDVRNDRLIDGLLNLQAGLLDDALADFHSLLADPKQTSAAKDFLNRMIGEIERLKES